MNPLAIFVVVFFAGVGIWAAIISALIARGMCG